MALIFLQNPSTHLFTNALTEGHSFTLLQSHFPFTHLTSAMMGKAFVLGFKNLMLICKVSWGLSESPVNPWRFTSSRSKVNMVGCLWCC